MATTQELEPAAVYSDGWLRYDVPGTPFFVNASPKGTAFHVLERGACPRGMAWTHAKRGSLSAALKLAAELTPSTPADIMARVKETTPCDHERFDRLAWLAQPGRRLWILPAYTEAGYRGLGEKATATGLKASSVESLFGTPASVWNVAFRTDSGREGSLRDPLTVEEARERWWITDGNCNLVSGGHADEYKVLALRDFEHPAGKVRQGREFIPQED
jgi:hypothetical protein